MAHNLLLFRILTMHAVHFVASNTADGKKSQTLNPTTAIPNPIPSPSPYFPPQTGTHNLCSDIHYKDGVSLIPVALWGGGGFINFASIPHTSVHPLT